MDLSYAQNMEDIHLARLFPGHSDGFYIDVGGGHVVADNVSFYFYEKGWRGLVIEPQASLAAAYRTVRPRDVVIGALAGRQPGELDFHEADQYHGLSTTVADNAVRAKEHGVAATVRRLPVTTLAALCTLHAPERIDFLKVDVEGAEADVLAGNDWARFRPRVVVIEAVTPWTMQDSSASFEPILLAAGYRFAFFDNLNRFYLAEEALAELMPRFPASPLDWGSVRHLGMLGMPQDNPEHPDHALARRIPKEKLSRLNSLSSDELLQLLPAGCDATQPTIRAALARIAAFHDGGYID